MKTIYSTLLLVAATAITGYSQVAFETIALTEAVEKAQKANKKILVDVYTAWCGPCKLMNKEVFSDQALGERLAKEYVSVKLDHEKSLYRKDLWNYGYDRITGYPTILVIDAKGFEIGRIIGYRDLEDFNKELDKYKEAKDHPITTAFAQLENYPKDQSKWKESLGVLQQYSSLCYKHKLEEDYKKACQQYYDKFLITNIQDKIDLNIFRQVKPPLKHAAAQFYIKSAMDYGSYLHMDYKTLAFAKAAKDATTEKEKEAIKVLFNAYYDECYEAWNGDVGERAYYLEEIFGTPQKAVEEQETAPAPKK